MTSRRAPATAPPRRRAARAAAAPGRPTPRRARRAPARRRPPGSSGGSGARSSSARRIAREPTTRAPSANSHARHGGRAEAQPLQQPVRDRGSARRAGTATPLSCSARSTAAHGCEAGIAYSTAVIGAPSIIPRRAPRRRRRQHADPPRRLPRRASWSHDWRFATVRESTADELGARAAQPARAARPRRSPTSTPRSSPRPCRSCGRSGPRWPSATSATRCRSSARACGPGMPIRMDNPREVGADRLVNAVAAYERVGGPCVIVDFGTAITYDCVGAAGEYIGGIIAPGVEISMEALTEPRRRDPEDRPHAAARADRQVDRRGDPLRRDLRLRGAGRRDRRAPARGAGRGDRGDRHRRPRRARSSRSASRSTRSTTCSRSPGLRLIHERNRRAPERRRMRVRSLHDPWELGGITIPNRVVLAPLAGHRQLVRAPAGQALRRRARGLGDGLEPRDPLRQPQDARRAARRAPGRARGRAGRDPAVRPGPRRSCAPPPPSPPSAAPT